MSAIISDDYRNAREAIAADRIMREMAYELVITHKMSPEEIAEKADMLAVRDEYRARGGEVPAYGLGDYRHALLIAAPREIVMHGRTRYVIAYFDATGWPQVAPAVAAETLTGIKGAQ